MKYFAFSFYEENSFIWSIFNLYIRLVDYIMKYNFTFGKTYPRDNKCRKVEKPKERKTAVTEPTLRAHLLIILSHHLCLIE